MSPEGDSKVQEEMMTRLKECSFIKRLFGDKRKEPVSETVIFDIYLFFVVASLFYIGLWIAKSDVDLIFLGRKPVIIAIISAMAIIVVKKMLDGQELVIAKVVLVALSYEVIAVIVRFCYLEGITLPFSMFVLVQGGALGLMYGVFTKPVIPKDVPSNHSDNRRDALKHHLTIWWRIGQVTLTMAALIVAGLLLWAFPVGGSKEAKIRLSVVGFSFLITLGPILLFVLWKHFVVESAILDTY